MTLYNKTAPDEAEALLDQMEALATGALAAQRNACVESFRAMWYNGHTAAILAKMGTRAAANFQAHAAAVAYLLGAGVELHPHEYTPPVEMPYTVHADGTVTLG